MVKPERAMKIESLLIQMASSGQIGGKVGQMNFQISNNDVQMLAIVQVFTYCNIFFLRLVMLNLLVYLKDLKNQIKRNLPSRLIHMGIYVIF